jgi:hypothetical protein
LTLGLEKAVRISNMNDHLKNEYVQSDGFHVVRKANDEARDGIVIPVINSAINNHPKR